MTVRAADGNSKDDPIDLAVEEEALERYYRRRIREVNRDAAPDQARVAMCLSKN
jgi:hypothetical protein